MVQNVLFLVGCALQTGATKEGESLGLPYFWRPELMIPAHMFAGRVIAGIAVGALTHVVPMYIAEVSLALHALILC
jgi:hypothetical protein